MSEGNDVNSGEPMPALRECPDKPVKGKEGQEIRPRQSDYSIVSMKSRNGDGEKGIARTRAEARDIRRGGPDTELENGCQQNWPP